MRSTYLAVDLGASSGRVMSVAFDGERFTLNEAHRFENGPLPVGDGLFWDAEGLWREITTGLKLACQSAADVRSIGIDTWGVDFALLDGEGRILGQPRHYRDPRNVAAMEAAHARVPRSRIYSSTGIQFMPLNTLYQLCAAARDDRGTFCRAQRLLFMPDLFNYRLTGRAETDRTIASTSQAMDARTGEWDCELLEMLGLPVEIMPEIRDPGTVCGPVSDEVAAQLGADGVIVTHAAGHDTAAAVVAAPGAGDDWAYISSGTWSLVGLELTAPLLGADSLAANFTNEAGAAGTIRFLKNVAGLWLLQECRRCWAEAGREFSYEQLGAMAERVTPLRSLIDPDDPAFSTPGDMPARILAVCRASNQPEPTNEGEMVRCILESLALRYDEVLRSAVALTGRRINTVHVVGGGSQNVLLNRLIADATGCGVVAGPVEATALGNAALQAVAIGDLPDVAAARRAVANSVSLREYCPLRSETQSAREQARDRFARFSGRNV